LMKEDVGNVPILVKLHGVPVMAFSEDGMSAIATKLSTPVMIEIQDNVELKDTIVVVMPKIMRREECPKNIGLGIAKNLKKPSQNSRGVPVGSKVGFKPHTEYRHVPKKHRARSIVDNDVELDTNEEDY
nr:hypothetical protein [Tanacetum cinerariifolium]